MNTYKNNAINSTTNTLVPVSSNGNNSGFFSEISTITPTFKSPLGVNVQSKPAISSQWLLFSLYPLISADKGLVKEASMSYVLKGKIVLLGQTKEAVPFAAKKENQSWYHLTLENLQTTNQIDYYLNFNDLGKKPEDFQKGDTVELKASSNLLTQQVTVNIVKSSSN